MQPALLQVIAFRTIFQVMLRKWNFNLPTTFLAVCSLNPLIPDNVIENLFGLIKAKKGKIIQTIHLYSFNPCRLLSYLSNSQSIMRRLSFLSRPMIYTREREMIFLFVDLLKSVTGFIEPNIDCNVKHVLPYITHTVELVFESLCFENDSYFFNHKQMKKKKNYFPKNFDLPKNLPNGYTQA